MVDKDMKEVSAIRSAFPHTSILFCWFHVLQVIIIFSLAVLILIKLAFTVKIEFVYINSLDLFALSSLYLYTSNMYCRGHKLYRSWISESQSNGCTVS